MECDINIVGCHCGHKHHSVLGNIVSVTVMQNVKTFFGAQKTAFTFHLKNERRWLCYQLNLFLFVCMEQLFSVFL